VHATSELRENSLEMKTKQVELRKIQLQHDEARDMLTTRAEERRVHKVATTTVNDLSFMSPPGSGVKRSVDAAPQVGRMKLQRLRANSLDANAIREMFVASLIHALSPGEINTKERNELMDKQEELNMEDEEFFRIIGGLGWSRRDFMRGKKDYKSPVHSRVPLVKSATSTPTTTTPSTRAGVDDDGSDSD
jgi:hypothetical protein